MPMTFSGALVDPVNGLDAPPLADLALSMSRMPRFAGHTRIWWTVLDHSVFVHAMAEKDDMSPELRLALLLHDAHEGLTGDIPSDMKSDEMRTMQKAIDKGIIDCYFPPGERIWNGMHDRIKEYDRRALNAEAFVVGPPRLSDLDGTALRALGFDEPRDEDVKLVRALLGNGRLGQTAVHLGVQAPGVRQYLRLVAEETQHFKHLLESV
jgi:hypothetical protein